MKTRYILLLLIAALLVQGVAALADSEISITHDKDWITAGTTDKATLTVTIDNSSVQVTGVTFAVESGYTTYATFGTTQRVSATEYKTTFQSTKSGSPGITVTVAYTVGGVAQTPVSKTVTQNVDHASPYNWALVDFEREVTVYTDTVITVKIKDKYGNLIDSRREDAEGTAGELFTFTCNSEPGAGFWNGATYTSPSYSTSVDSDGIVTVTYRTSTVAGDNLIEIKPPNPISSRLINIEGVADAEPVSIEVSVSPNVGTPPYVPADGESKFYLTYTLLDQFGNPSSNRTIEISTSVAGEEASFTSNENGQVSIQYGPRDTIGVITITARSADNPGVSVSTTVEFVSTDPEDMVLTATPQVMASYDVDSSVRSQIRAKVIDEKGNPVEDETVTFILSNIVSVGATTADPYLIPPTTATTDENGYAVVEFVPGAFETNHYDSDYDETAHTTCDVTATWGTVSRTLTLEWMNFPYLSVETKVEPETVEQNGTVQVTIDLIGNGYALQPDPIDVMLVIDRSGSMGSTDISPSRMAAAKTAANTFINNMDSSRDRVGLTSFSSSTLLDESLTYNFADVQASVNSLSASGATQLRRAVYEGIKNVKENGREDAVKAVIIMTDGNWNYDGTPLAQGTGLEDWDYWSGNTIIYDWFDYYPELGGGMSHYGRIYVPIASYYGGYTYDRRYVTYYTNAENSDQNMTVYASNNHVKLYTISFAGTLDSGAVEGLQNMAEGTGGFYEHAPTGSQLQEIYERIAGELKTEAGVNTTMDLEFTGIVINNDYSNPVDDAFEYESIDGISTTIEKWNQTHTVTQKDWHDQTSDWLAGRSLNFGTDEIGTIHLGETWEANFTLNMTTSGNVNIFGPGSQIVFNDGEAILSLPDTFVTVVPNLNATGPTSGAINIYNLSPTNSEPYTDYVDLTWYLNYTGIEDTVNQELSWIRLDDGVEKKFATITVPYSQIDSTRPDDVTNTAKLDVTNLASGSYQIKVVARDGVNPKDTEYYEYVLINRTGMSYIRIE